MAIVDSNRFVVVYQENIGGYNSITMKVVDLIPNITVSNPVEVYCDENLYSYDANPVITVEHCSSNQYYYYLVVWDENSGIYQPKGLYYRIMQEDLNSVFTEINEDPTIITNTDNNSLNPSVTSSFISKSNPEFHVAWEQQSTTIKYSKIYLAHRNNAITISNYSEPSAGRYAINYNPSIAITLNRPRVSWLTRHPVTLINEAILRTYGSYWGSIKAYTYSGGDNVESVSINNRNTAYGLVMSYGGDGREIRYTKGFTTTYEASPTQNNKDVQVSNGDDFTDMFISSLKTTSLPYLFEFNQIDESLNKSSSANSSVGRSANITSNNSLFYCTIKDVVVDGEQIAFVEIPEEEKEISADKLMNEYLETEGFELKDKTDFTFKLSSGSTMDQETNKLLTSKNYVNFIVELVDAKDESLIETLDKINFDELNSTRTEEKSFQVNTDNIKTGNVKVRLKVEKSIDCNFTIADVISDKRELPKEGYINLDLKTNQIITEYKLNRNYPNPFNPVTTIS